MFWEVLGEISQEELSLFYKFCTGLTRVPIDGFKTLQGAKNKIQPFCIDNLRITDKNRNNKLKLIEADTCFNRIYLPEYKNKEEMKRSLTILLENDCNYFGNL